MRPKRIVLFPPRGPSSLLLLCCPFAGGDVSVFARWPQKLPAHVQVGAVQHAARGTRSAEPPRASVQEVVEEFGNELLPLEPTLPLVLYGHSYGALVAFELAHWLRARGRPVRQLVVSGRFAPSIVRTEPLLSKLSDDHLVRELGTRYGYTFPAALLAEPELLRRILPPLQADLALAEVHRPLAREPLDCPVLVMSGKDDPSVDKAELEPWQDTTRGAFGLELFPGGHFYIQSHPEAPLARLSELLGSLLP